MGSGADEEQSVVQAESAAWEVRLLPLHAHHANSGCTTIDTGGGAATPWFARRGRVDRSKRLDRLGRSLKDHIVRAEELRTGGVGLKSVKEAIDTDSPTGQLVFHIFGALAEFERALIRECTQAGLQAARARGRVGGRKKRLNAEQRRHAVDLYRSRQHTLKEICVLMWISRATLYAYVKELSKQG